MSDVIVCHFEEDAVLAGTNFDGVIPIPTSCIIRASDLMTNMMSTKITKHIRSRFTEKPNSSF